MHKSAFLLILCACTSVSIFAQPLPKPGDSHFHFGKPRPKHSIVVPIKSFSLKDTTIGLVAYSLGINEWEHKLVFESTHNSFLRWKSEIVIGKTLQSFINRNELKNKTG